MPRQLALFLAAVQFLTRVPVPAIAGFRPDWTARSARYFPLVGMLVGAASAAVLLAASTIWDGAIPELLAIAAGVLLTGAFHEDGLADSCDGLGGGTTRDQRLAIMKDSRVGTYGVLGLGLVLALKIAALAQMPLWTAAVAMVAANGGGRGAAVIVMGWLPYAGDRDWTKVKPVAEGVRPLEMGLACAFAAVAISPMIALHPGWGAAALASGAGAALLMAVIARRLIGGWVGDTLGATEQLFETAFLVAIAGAAGRVG